MKDYFHAFIKLFPKALEKLQENNPLILASGTAFFTTFSLAPMVIIIANVLSLYFKRENVTENLYHKISDVFGEVSATQIQSIATNLRNQASNEWITIFGFIFLIFIATTLFHAIKTSINQIWNVRLKKNKLKYNLRARAISLGIILISGFLLLTSIFIDSIVSIIRSHTIEIFLQLNAGFIFILSKTASLVIVFLWFVALFRFLPDARVKWKPIAMGSLITALLFTIGKAVLERLLINSDVGDIFGASASIVLILLFIFYASMIVYFGASFTLAYANEFCVGVRPRKHSERYETKKLGSEKF